MCVGGGGGVGGGAKLYRHVFVMVKKVRGKSREYHNLKPQPLPDTKRKEKQTKQTSANRTNLRKVPRPAPSEAVAKPKGHKNRTTQGKTQNKPPRRINHKATKSKTNTGATAPERQAE